MSLRKSKINSIGLKLNSLLKSKDPYCWKRKMFKSNKVCKKLRNNLEKFSLESLDEIQT